MVEELPGELWTAGTDPGYRGGVAAGGLTFDAATLAAGGVAAKATTKALRAAKRSLPRGVTPSTARGAFKPGELFETSFETSAGRLDFLAEVEVTGSRLHLRDVAVYPRGVDRLEGLGIGELKSLADDLAEQARAAGFTELRITGTRAVNRPGFYRGSAS